MVGPRWPEQVPSGAGSCGNPPGVTLTSANRTTASVTVRKRRGGADALIRSGALAAYGFREGHAPGSEVAGTVTSVADDVDTAWIGRRVCWCAEPPAASGSSAERGKRLRELGATHVLDRSGTSDGPAPGSYDVVIGTVAGAHMPSFFDRLSPNGRRWNGPRWPTSSHSPHARPIRVSRRPRTAGRPCRHLGLLPGGTHPRIDPARARDPGRRPPEAAGEPVLAQRAAPVRLQTPHRTRDPGREHHTAAHPSSTGSTTPLMLLAASDARKRMAAACSSGRARRPRLTKWGPSAVGP